MFSQKTAGVIADTSGKILATIYKHPVLSAVGATGVFLVPAAIGAATNVLGFTDRRKMLGSELRQEELLKGISTHTRPKEESSKKVIVPFLS